MGFNKNDCGQTRNHLVFSILFYFTYFGFWAQFNLFYVFRYKLFITVANLSIYIFLVKHGNKNDAMNKKKNLWKVILTIFFFSESLSKKIRDDLSNERVRNPRNRAFSGQGAMLDETRTLLNEFYAPFNKRLSAVLEDTRFDWNNDEKYTRW